MLVEAIGLRADGLVQGLAHGHLLAEAHGRLDGLDEADVSLQLEGEEIPHVLDIEDEEEGPLVAHGHGGEKLVIFEELDELDWSVYFLPSGSS